MGRKRKVFWGKTAVIFGSIPLLIWAHEYGPDAGYTNVPGELGTCAQANCHTGLAMATTSPSQGVTVAFPNGLTYAPGAKQHLIVTVADPATTQVAWGFQLTARTSNSTTQAGSFASTDSYTGVECASPTNLANESPLFVMGQSQTCPASQPLAYIEHDLAGYQHNLGKTLSATYEFDWTPPATNVGNITIYAAGNAGAGGPPNPNGHIYTNSYTVAPSTGGGGNTPTITSVFNAAGFQNGVFPGSFISIKGSNLSPVAYGDWSNSIVGSQLPTQLNGVTVTIGGKPAYIFAMAQLGPGSDQINVQTPDAGFGSMQVVVTTPSGSSAPFTVNSQQYGPAYWPWANSQPVATHADCSPAFKTGTYPASAFDPRCQNLRPAQPGETITLWGTGFGPTNPVVPAGQVPGPQFHQTNAVTATVGSIATPAKGALSGFPGDYQINVTVPASLADGDYPVVVTINGITTPTMTLNVHH